MTAEKIAEKLKFKIISSGNMNENTISKVFCCDLLSLAMSKSPAGAAWVTVMGNINTLAVASLTEAACIVLAENTALDEQALQKAQQQNITVFQSELPVFETALMIEKLIHE